MVKYDTIEDEIWVLTEEGNEIADKGSHEARSLKQFLLAKKGYLFLNYRYQSIYFLLFIIYENNK